MRRLLIVPLSLLAAGCWKPGPGQINPARYPWDQPTRIAEAPPQQPTYCVVALESTNSSGITFGGESRMTTNCTLAPNASTQASRRVPAALGGETVGPAAPDECRDQSRRLAELTERYHLDVRGHDARIDRSAWEKGAEHDWSAIAWGLAFARSCESGLLGTYEVRMLDRQGRMLAYKRLSTTNECHGDHARLAPGEVEYRC